jgi:hypothetical protein
MRSRLLAATVLSLVPVSSWALGPSIFFQAPAQNVTPPFFGSLPFPNDLYFDQGRPGDGDGTLLNPGASIGLAANVVTVNTASFEQAFDLLEGFGTTTAVYFFASGPLDPVTVPLTPSLADPVFCADAATGTPVPILVKRNIDSRIPNVLGVLPAPGRPLAPATTYTCVVRRSVTGGGQPVEPAAGWVAVRDGTSANTDADAIHDPVVTMLGGLGVPASDIAAMTVFTTEPTASDLLTIRDTVLPGEPVPAADFTSRPELVFDSPAEITTLLGAPNASVATVATGFYEAPRFQTADPNGDGPLHDLPVPPSFVTCAVACETTDERFTHGPGGTPLVLSTPEIPFTVVVPSGTPPPGGWPIVIQQHGLGGQRDTVVAFGVLDAPRGYASIGIDAVAHGYRYFKDMSVPGDCTPARPCPQDSINNFGGSAHPDGFVDGSYLGFDVGFLTVNLGFFQAFHNFIGIRDNFRQTYVDLMSLVRLIKGHSIDAALGTTIDDGNIYYMGHSLGGLMGAGFVPLEPDLRASVLNAAGGGLTTQLFLNSSIGAGAQALVQGILGLDPANVSDQFALQPNLTQMMIDPADGVNLGHLLLNPALGAPRNVILVEDWGDQVVPNQANEVLAVAAGLPLFDPFIQNLHHSPFTLPIANFATPKTVMGNAAGGLATAVFLQNGPATHAASLGTTPGTLTFVPEFGRFEEFPTTGNAFPLLARSVRVPNAGIFDDLLDWFDDIRANGPPGRFSLADDPNYNPVQNVEAPAGASVAGFFARTVDGGGALAGPEPTPDVVMFLTSNAVATRLTAARSILGSTPSAQDRDVPPGPSITVGTPGVLPFFVSLQRLVPGLSTFSLTLGYTTAELAAAGITPGTGAEGSLLLGQFSPGACTIGGAVCSENGECGVNGPCVGASYTRFINTQVDVVDHTATASGLTALGTFALLSSDDLGVYELGAGIARTDCRAQWRLINPNAPAPTPHSRARAIQSCQDGDLSCDADGAANGLCTFRVAVCFDRLDPLVPTCGNGTTQTYALRMPLPLSGRPMARTNAQALVEALAALGGTVGGTQQNEVTFTVAQGGGACTPLSSLVVESGKTRTFRGVAKQTSSPRDNDSDKLRLRCLP